MTYRASFPENPNSKHRPAARANDTAPREHGKTRASESPETALDPWPLALVVSSGKNFDEQENPVCASWFFARSRKRTRFSVIARLLSCKDDVSRLMSASNPERIFWERHQVVSHVPHSAADGEATGRLLREVVS